MQVHQAEAHHLADQAHGRRPIVEPLELIVDPGRALGQPVELAIAVAAKQPHAVRPVAGVVAHRQQERDATRKQVARQRHHDQHHDRGKPPAARSPGPSTPTSGWAQNRAKRAVDHHHVPLDRHAHRHVAGDVAVQQQHQHHADDQRPAAGETSRMTGHTPVRAPCRRGPSRRRGARGAGRRDSGGTSARRSQAKRVTGLLLVITQTTAGKWWFSFETPAQNQSASCTALAPAIQLPASDEAHGRGPVVLGPQRQEDRAIGDRQHRHQHDDGQQAAQSLGRRRDQRTDQEHQQRQVQRDVEPGAPRCRRRSGSAGNSGSLVVPGRRK